MAQPVLVAAPAAWPYAAPAVEHVSSFSLDADYNASFACTFELEIGNPALTKVVALPQVPLQGMWHVSVWRNGDVVSLALQHSPLAVGALGTDLVGNLTLERYSDGAFTVVAQSTSRWATVPQIDPVRQSCSSGFALTVPPAHLNDPAQRSVYRLSFKLHRPVLQPVAAPVERQVGRVARQLGSRDAKQLAQISPDTHTLAQPHDVRIFFPHICDYGPFELWTSESLLVASSTYFRNLFASDDVEIVPAAHGRTHVARAQAPPKIIVKPFEDSDDETDWLVDVTLDPLTGGPNRPLPFEYKQITIKGHEAAYTTWRAGLLWLETRYIEFAPLLSSFSGANDPAERRNEELEAIHAENPRLPYPASPKSVYRLATTLGLSYLPDEASYFFYDVLTLDTAPVELFSDLARDDWFWRVTVRSWLVKHWDDVKGTEAWTETMRRVSEGEIEGAGPAMVELLEEVGKRNNVKP
ncbi:hypothetical protein JCM3775_004105 [Rhodotorula graminis]|uniref:BTB domain-containing protein n=1 Tax=Rhodotorula graminis (strain WP1) TaxID=578459 RepID=A0A0P9EZ82_RHOGW|nr:uncharacterized protein RHOBADRAFT_46599 [Rhodotorula graminis WP1]KPV72554.1 hypothetical protein RHOBADRAFT_46599 [Rhodotorula graminis WP1]